VKRAKKKGEAISQPIPAIFDPQKENRKENNYTKATRSREPKNRRERRKQTIAGERYKGDRIKIAVKR